jgi:dolichol-phosphate mannosyltransferase
VSVDVTAVIPMHNEAENAAETLGALAAAFEAEGWTYELIPVDDGSTDETLDVLELYALDHPEVRPHSYRRNRGRGYALRQGFDAARGNFVVSLDADLSYSAETGVEMIRTLMEDPETDIVLASQWMPGGSIDGVPWDRAFISWAGNVVLRRTLPIKIWTSTSICRAYRIEVLRSFDLASEGKEIHLEILSEAITLGYGIKEIPAVLGSRKKGHSKFRPNATIISHLLFTIVERPATIFAFAGLAVMLAGLPIGLYLFTVFLRGQLNPERPLMTVLVLLFLGGGIGFGFALQSLQLLELRRSLIRLRSDMSVERRQRAEDMVQRRRQLRLAEKGGNVAALSDATRELLTLPSAAGAERE